MTSSNNYLLILNSLNDIKLNLNNEETFVYSLNSGSLKNKNSQSLNSYKKFHKIAFDIKDQYINLIGNLSKYFENTNSFNGKNFFYFTEISAKRTEYLKNFDSICHIFFIKSIIDKYNINKIIYYNVSDEIIATINSFSNIKFEILKKYKNIQYQKQKIFLRQVNFAAKILFLKILLLFFSKKKFQTSDNYYFSTYPKNFNNEYQIKYGEYYKKNSVFILSLLTDNIHQKFNISKFFNIIKSLNKRFIHNYIISDSYIKFKDISFFMIASVKFRNIFKKNLNHFTINNLDFSSIIKSDFEKSYERYVRLLTISRSYIRLAKKIEHQANFHYYLFEYPYGRMLSLSFSKSNINRVGFQHGPAGYLKMICYISEVEKNYMYSNKILPNSIAVEDFISQKIYEAGNYSNISIMPEVYRLKYLNKIKRLNPLDNHHLIACGLHDGLMIFKIMLKKIKLNKNINYILKLHPKAANHEIINLVNYYNLKNLKIAEQQIEYYLEYIDKVYFSYTSIGNEAAFLGIKKEILYSSFKLNESIFCNKENFVN